MDMRVSAVRIFCRGLAQSSRVRAMGIEIFRERQRSVVEVAYVMYFQEINNPLLVR